MVQYKVLRIFAVNGTRHEVLDEQLPVLSERELKDYRKYLLNKQIDLHRKKYGVKMDIVDGVEKEVLPSIDIFLVHKELPLGLKDN